VKRALLDFTLVRRRSDAPPRRRSSTLREAGATA
jgi:hypothetical protein